ncbi:MAG: YceI family protein [Flavobacteriales bacterium]|nr:YceI family protein [Flavobacteriales bacterium]MCX7769179.1 YceI family protein [Flavobacteriales bacterium]MDW8411024.1 YceI family protein [Flavobacteriales bacterium]
MKQFVFLIAVLCGSAAMGSSQKYLTRNGEIRFFSEAPLENIEAVNRLVLAIYNASTKELAFRVTMKAFEFEKAAMQEHFNRDYVHSDKFPVATFEGRIVEPEELKIDTKGLQKVKVAGKLTIHGVTRSVSEWGTISIENGVVKLASEFTIALSDYNIRVPTDKVRNISNTIKIFVHATLEEVKN